MKLKAITLVEIIIAMSILTALSLVAIPALKQNSPDNEIAKFKHIYGTVSSITSALIDNKALYPDNYGFANTDYVTIRSTGQSIGGRTKYRQAFKDYFNVLEEDIVINESKIPIYETGAISGAGNSTITTVSSLTCFTNNTGSTFCPPETPLYDGVKILRNIYLRVHVNEKLDIEHAIYFKIAADGKIEFPYKIDDKFDCTESQYNKYTQCKVISALDDF